MIVAIDGPAGSGKSTVARAIARRRGLTYLDTGAMYRSVTLACLERGCDLADASAVAEVASASEVAFAQGEDGTQRVLLDGRDVTAPIREARVDRSVSVVSAVPAVREAMVAQQRRLAAGGDVVAEGRDIGTVVFPDAEVKVFLTADPRERARRRVLQRHEADAPTQAELDAEVEETLAALLRRDDIDSHRAVAPLVAAPDAVEIDSTAHTIDEVVDMISRLIDERR